MATLSNSNLTLADWAKRSDPDGRVPIVAELLSQSNEILDDCVFKEGNLPTGDDESNGKQSAPRDNDDSEPDGKDLNVDKGVDPSELADLLGEANNSLEDSGDECGICGRPSLLHKDGPYRRQEQEPPDVVMKIWSNIEKRVKLILATLKMDFRKENWKVTQWD